MGKLSSKDILGLTHLASATQELRGMDGDTGLCILGPAPFLLLPETLTHSVSAMSLSPVLGVNDYESFRLRTVIIILLSTI